jgi:hypothetical protein
MSFSINGASFKGIGTLGAGQPDAGYYEVEGLQVEYKQGDKADARRLHVQFANGFKMFTFIHLPVEGLPEKSFKGRLAALKTILVSFGFSDEQIETGDISDAWFVTGSNGGRKAYVEFVPGQQGVQGSYAEITKFMDKAGFEKAVASGVKPAARQNNGGGVPKTGAPVVPGAVPAAPSSTVGGVVGTVAPAPAGGLRLPPPPAVGVAR